MPGFMGIVSDKVYDFPEDFDLSFPVLTSRREETKRFENAWFKRSIIDKFIDDKVYKEDRDVFICSDGLMLNARELRNKYACEDNFQLLKRLHENSPSSFPLELRGDFDGVICDKNLDSWALYTNHIGSKWVFYYFDNEAKRFVFGTELKMVVAGMRSLGIEPELCEEGAYFLLTFGYMLGDYTLIKGVKKISPGSTLTLKNWELESTEYYRLQNTPYVEDSEDKIIKTLDELFRVAIKAEYDKDLEYGYRHVATLSGGLDSRMNVCYARKLGYKDILNITFSQSNYLDEKIAKKIASDWGYDFLFYSLDNGNYLRNIDLPVMVNDGLVLFSGSAHALKIQSIISWSNIGLVHTGMIGDLILGSYLLHPHHSDVSEEIIKKTAYSSKLMEKVDSEVFNRMKDSYATDELFAFGERCVNGVFNGYRISEPFTEYASPFLHVDFLDYAMSISPILRYEEKVYLDWILQEAPEAAKYSWEKTGLLINAGKLRKFLRKGMRYARRKIFGSSPMDSMNPFNYWYKTNDSLRETFEDYYRKHIDLLSKHPELQKDVEKMFNEGTPLEKTQPLTLLAAIKLHGLEK